MTEAKDNILLVLDGNQITRNLARPLLKFPHIHKFHITVISILKTP